MGYKEQFLKYYGDPLAVQAVSSDLSGGGDTWAEMQALAGRRKNAESTQGLADKFLSMGGPFTNILGAYFAGKADKENRQNAAVDGQISLYRDKLKNEQGLAEKFMDYSLKNLQEERAAQREHERWERDNRAAYEKELRQRGYAVEDRDFNSRAAQYLKAMDIMSKDSGESEFEKELQKQRAKQFAEMSGNIAEGEAALTPLSESINKALELNKLARSGGLANLRQGTARFMGGGEQTTAGAELQGIMQNELVGQLKKIFGGQISEGERAYLDKLYAADLSMSQGEREALIRNVYQSALNRINKDKAAFNSLFGAKPVVRRGAADEAALNDYNSKYGL